MPIKLAMLGMWHSHAEGIVRQVAAHPDEFTLAGFYDPEPNVVAERKEKWESLLKTPLKICESPEELVKLKIDGVVVDGRVHDNISAARLALEHGHNIMLEKPAGHVFDDYRRLIDLADRKHLHVQMIYLFRYMSAVQEMFRLAREDELGQLYEFRARLPKDLGTYDRFIDELKLYSGGMFFEMGGHVIDMMITLLGTPREVKSVLGHHHTAGPQNYMDNGVAVFRFDNAIGIIEVPAFEVAPHQRRIEAYGNKGACVIPHLGSGHLANRDIQPIEVSSGKSKAWRSVELPAATLQIADLREFAAIIGGRKPEYSHEHDLTVQKWLLRGAGMLGSSPA